MKGNPAQHNPESVASSEAPVEQAVPARGGTDQFDASVKHVAKSSTLR